MNKTELKELWEQVKANSKKLNDCSCHNFVNKDPAKIIGSRFVCLNCGGEADVCFKHAYDQGASHGKNK